MQWTVTERGNLNKQVRKLPQKVQYILIALKKDLEINGPIRGDMGSQKQRNKID